MINDLPLVVGLALFMGVSVIVAVGPFILIRTYYAALLPDRTQDMALAVGVRVGALHGLLLAIVFSVVQTDYMEQRHLVAEEAAATAKVYFNLERYGDPAADTLRQDVKAYVREVIDGEWPALEHEKLSAKAWAMFDRIYNGALNLEARTPRQEALRNNILTSLDKISDFRQGRLFATSAHLPRLFWVIAVLGSLIVAGLFYAFEYTRLNAVLLTSYVAFTGAILYFIYVMNNPFSGPPALQPVPLDVLYHDAMEEPAG